MVIKNPCEAVVAIIAWWLCPIFFIFILACYILAILFWPFHILRHGVEGKPGVPHDLAVRARWLAQRVARHAPSNRRLDRVLELLLQEVKAPGGLIQRLSRSVTRIAMSATLKRSTAQAMPQLVEAGRMHLRMEDMYKVLQTSSAISARKLRSHSFSGVKGVDGRVGSSTRVGFDRLGSSTRMGSSMFGGSTVGPSLGSSLVSRVMSQRVMMGDGSSTAEASTQRHADQERVDEAVVAAVCDGLVARMGRSATSSMRWVRGEWRWEDEGHY